MLNGRIRFALGSFEDQFGATLGAPLKQAGTLADGKLSTHR